MTGRLSTRHIPYSFQRIWEETRARLLPDTDAVAPRHGRSWELIRMRLGADTNASGGRYGRVWGQKRTHTVPRSP